MSLKQQKYHDTAAISFDTLNIVPSDEIKNYYIIIKTQMIITHPFNLHFCLHVLHFFHATIHSNR